MKRKTLLSTAVAVGLFAAAAIAGVAAQTDAQQSPEHGMGMMGPGMMGPNGTMGPGMMGNRGMGPGMMGPGMMMGYGPAMEGQLAYVKAELAITDKQKEAWDSYVSAVKSRSETMQGMHAAMWKAMDTGSALERLDARIEAMQSMVDSMKAIKPATKALYEALSDEQKKEADLLLGNGCCMM